MLTVQGSGRGQCLWCAADKEGITVEFHDGSLQGFLCKTDFWTLVKRRGTPASTSPPRVPTPVPTVERDEDE